MNMTADKAIAAFITSALALVAVFGVSTEWATPTAIQTISVVLGAIATAAMTWLVPNRPK
jgi:hypothetical protein